MPDSEVALGATKSASTLLVMFIPSEDRFGEPIDQEYWVDETLNLLGEKFGGGTAFPQGRGVWRDDAQDGILLFDYPVIIQCYTNDASLEKHNREFLVRLGTEKQGAVGFVIDRDYLEIAFELPEAGS